MNNTITEIMSNRYGTGTGVFDPISILWAADRAADKVALSVVKQQLKDINKLRNKLKLPVAVFEFGHRLF